jgi:hypothetical protein
MRQLASTSRKSGQGDSLALSTAIPENVAKIKSGHRDALSHPPAQLDSSPQISKNTRHSQSRSSPYPTGIAPVSLIDRAEQLKKNSPTSGLLSLPRPPN